MNPASRTSPVKHTQTEHSVRERSIARAISILVIQSALVFSSSHVQAELQALDDAHLATVTGRAGLTIDIETEYTIAEHEYVDAGSWFFRDISFQGIGGGLVDNIRAVIDITDGVETLASGFSDWAFYASLGYLDPNERDVDWALTEYDDGNGNFGKTYGDGDALIHVIPTNPGFDWLDQNNPAVWEGNFDSLQQGIDFHIEIGEFGLRSSDKNLETVLTSNFSAEGYLGNLDIHITNNGNNFSFSNGAGGKPKNVSLQDSYIHIDAHFIISDLDVDNTNNATNTIISRQVTQPGLTLRNFKIHNQRGKDQLGHFGYAHIESKIAAAQGVLPSVERIGQGLTEVDGQAIYDVNVTWDWDISHISFGDTAESIGSVYLTDFVIRDTSLVISAH